VGFLGNDYIDHARELSQKLARSNDYDDLRLAIDELNAIGGTLGADLFDEIMAPEKRRDSLPIDDDYDDSDSSLQSPASPTDESAELEMIFTSLL
jgi:hypothetical protein